VRLAKTAFVVQSLWCAADARTWPFIYVIIQIT